MDEESEGDGDNRQGVAKMRANEIKAELEMRGISYEGIFEKVNPMTPYYFATYLVERQTQPRYTPLGQLCSRLKRTVYGGGVGRSSVSLR